MRLGIDAELIGRDGSGNETYLREMIRALQSVAEPTDEFVLFGEPSPALEALAGPVTSVVATRRGMRGELRLGRLMTSSCVDVALATYNAPLLFRGAKATVVHDVSFRRVPETFPTLLRARIAMSVRRSVAVSDLIVTVSQFCKAELCDVYPRLRPERVVVTYDAAAAAFFETPDSAELDRLRAHYDLPSEFVLAVGNVQPRKNLLRLLEATEAVGVPLIVAGKAGWMSDKGLTHRLSSAARWLGRVPVSHLAALYRLCSVFAYPSLYEGFGLPVVEAMASGAVVVTSDSSALAEVAGDAGILVDPRSVESIAGGLKTGLTLGSALPAFRLAARERARAFSWEQSAAELDRALKSIAP